MKRKLNFQVAALQANQRIDKFLVEQLKNDFSRSDIKKFIEAGYVHLNAHAVKAHQKARENDLIEIEVFRHDKQTEIPAVDIHLDIVYDDEFIFIVNKCAGMVVHPAAGHYEDTLVNALLFHTKCLSDINGLTKPGIVHRLDKDTSGLLVVAKDNKTHRFLAGQFKGHTVKKMYVAIVSGSVEYDEGIIDEPISRSPFDRKKMKVCHASSREAKTFYRVLSRCEDASVLEVFPQTGRTHQIRVHMAYLGHPILGDSQYGKNQSKYPIKRQALHAKMLGFIHPESKKYVEFIAEVPLDMQNIINKLA
ncbi:MAG: RluA family pseudouridine synthase [Candidatus Omnitrophica bacterium]|nr:RluA family pseudouridine synthase [Candidatus Omnitrophota bacterium]